MLQSFELTQVVPQPTRVHTGTFPGSSMLIDLALLSEPSQLVNCEVIPPLGNSDHNGIDLTLKVAHKTPLVKTSKQTVWRYALAHFETANALIAEADWSYKTKKTLILYGLSGMMYS